MQKVQGRLSGKATVQALIVISLIYILIRVLVSVSLEPVVMVDSQDYLYNASTPLNFDFFCFSKPAGVALVYKMLAQDLDAIVRFQRLFSLISWLAFAWACVLALPDTTIRPVFFSGILLYSLTGDITAWDAVIMSESISLSLMLLFLAAAIYFFTRPAWRGLLPVCLFGAAWALVKESNALLLFLTAILFLAAGVLLFRRRRLLWAGAFLCLVFMTVQGFSNLGERWKFPMLNVIGHRVLVDPQALDFFEAHGMPVDEALMQMQYAWGNSQGSAFLNSPELRPFQTWFHAHARGTYMQYLLRHPLESLREPLMHLDQVFPRPVEGKAASILPGIWIGLVAVGVLTTFILAWSGRGGPLAWPVFFWLLLVIPHMWIVWNGDVMEMARHAFQLRVHVALATGLALLVGLRAWQTDKPGSRGWWPAGWARLRAALAPGRLMLGRGAAVSGWLIACFALLYDFVLAPGFFQFRFYIGPEQWLAAFAGLLCMAGGLWLIHRDGAVSSQLKKRAHEVE